MLEIELPRWINAETDEAEDMTLPKFCDASRDPYSALEGIVNDFVHLVATRAREAPIKKGTIGGRYRIITQLLFLTIESFS